LLLKQLQGAPLSLKPAAATSSVPPLQPQRRRCCYSPQQQPRCIIPQRRPQDKFGSRCH
jgi:hypothetical protein